MRRKPPIHLHTTSVQNLFLHKHVRTSFDKNREINMSAPVNIGGDWLEMTDPNTGKKYYANKTTKKTQGTYPEELNKKEEPKRKNRKRKNQLHPLLQLKKKPRRVTRQAMTGLRSRTQVVVRHTTITKRQTKLLGSNLEVVQSGSRARTQILERRTTST